jgi:hypothetical protein
LSAVAGHRVYYRQVGRLFTLENAIDVASRAAIHIAETSPYEINPPEAAKRRS